MAYKRQRNYCLPPSILKIKEKTNSSACFLFRTVRKEDLLYQLSSLDSTKPSQKFDIPANIIKKNYDIFSEFIFENSNNIILTSLFPEQLKYAYVKPIFKKDSRNDKKIIDQSVFFLTFLKYTNDFYTNN